MISVFYNVYLKKFGGKKVIDIKQYFLYLISTYYAHFWVRRDELQSFKHENHIVRLLNCVTFELFCFASTIFIRDHDMTLAVMTEVEKKKKKKWTESESYLAEIHFQGDFQGARKWNLMVK